MNKFRDVTPMNDNDENQRNMNIEKKSKYFYVFL